MMVRHSQHLSKRTTPQSQPLHGENQVENNAGGFVYSVNKWQQAERFLILGSASGTYYVSGNKLTRENASILEACAREDINRMVGMIVDVSVKGRAPKNDPAVFALALLAKYPEARTALPAVCRIGTHIFQYVEAVNELHGWSRSRRRAVADWLCNKSLVDLCYQVTKYQSRDGMSVRDVLRLSHPKFSDDKQGVARWIACGKDGIGNRGIDVEPFTPRNYPAVELPEYLYAFEELKATDDVRRVVVLIDKYNFVREHVPTGWLDNQKVWEALLQRMPATALLRNLATLTRIGLVKPLSDTTEFVLDKLNANNFRKARVHPISVLIGLKTYAAGRGFRGQNTWTPVSQICERLDDLFYESFEWVEPTGKRFLLGVDVSGSMSSSACHGCEVLRACEASAAMAMFISRKERRSQIYGFAETIRDIGITSKMSLPDACRKMVMNNFGPTDCAALVQQASKEKIKADCFMVITDNETWHGHKHVSVALREYRNETGINAKMLVLATTATQFTIADPNDAGMLDIAGFDASVPQVLQSFVGVNT